MFDVKGDRPQWQVIYERLQQMEIGEVIKYTDLAALLPSAPGVSARSAFARAVRAMEDEHHRTFANVRLVGYKMVDASEHEGIARRHHKRAKRQLKTAKRKVVSADRSRLSREERARLDAMELNLSRQMEMTSRLESRVKNEVQERKAADATLSERVDRLTELLERHGIGSEAKAT
jgi:hypothetical protein